MNKQILNVYLTNFINNKKDTRYRPYSSYSIVSTEQQVNFAINNGLSMPLGVALRKEEKHDPSMTNHLLGLTQLVDIINLDFVKGVVANSTVPVNLGIITNIPSIASTINNDRKISDCVIAKGCYPKMSIDQYFSLFLNGQGYLPHRNIQNRDVVLEIIRLMLELNNMGKCNVSIGADLYKNKQNHFLKSMTDDCRMNSYHIVGITNFRRSKKHLSVVK